MEELKGSNATKESKKGNLVMFRRKRYLVLSHNSGKEENQKEDFLH